MVLECAKQFLASSVVLSRWAIAKFGNHTILFLVKNGTIVNAMVEVLYKYGEGIL